jgi:hypothetical protein
MQGLVLLMISFQTDKYKSMLQGFAQSYSKSAFRKFYNHLNDIQDFIRSVCFRPVGSFLHIEFDYELLNLPDKETRPTAGVTGQQGMLTPPWYPIPTRTGLRVEFTLLAIWHFLLYLLD